MADEKKAKLSIVLRTVDQATAKIKTINDRLDKITKPMRDFRKQLSELREKSGLADVIGGFKGVGSAISGVLSKVGMIGGMLAAAGYGLMSIIGGFDELGTKAKRIGVGVDTLAQLRYVADQSGASAEALDAGLESLSKSMGEMRAGGGNMTKFLGTVSPVLLRQLKATKSNEEAFLLLADAMTKIKDPAKRAVFAAKTLGDATLAQTLGNGSKGIQELRNEYFGLAGSQEEAAAKAGEVDGAMKKLRAATDGVKAALVTGLAPAVTVIIDRLREWFAGNRERIAEWAKSIGEKLPGAIQRVVEWLGKAWDKVTAFVDAIGGLKNAAIGAGLIMAGPLIASVVNLGSALFTAGSRAGQLAKAMRSIPPAPAGGAGGGALGRGALGAAGSVLLPVAAAQILSDATGGSLVEVARSKGIQTDSMLGLANMMLQKELGPSVSDVVFQAMDGVRARGDISAQAASALSGGTQTEAKVTIEIPNAPKGTRVSTDPQSTADVDLSVGYQMIPGGL